MTESRVSVIVILGALVAMVAIVAMFALLAGAILPGRAPADEIWSGAVGAFMQALAAIVAGLIVFYAAQRAFDAAKLQGEKAVEAARIQGEKAVEAAERQVAAQAREANALRLTMAKTLAGEAEWELDSIRAQLIRAEDWVGVIDDPKTMSGTIDLDTFKTAEMFSWSLDHKAYLGAPISALIINLRGSHRGMTTCVKWIVTEPDGLRGIIARQVIRKSLGEMRASIGAAATAFGAVRNCRDVTELDRYSPPTAIDPLT